MNNIHGYDFVTGITWPFVWKVQLILIILVIFLGNTHKGHYEAHNGDIVRDTFLLVEVLLIS